MRYTVLMVVQEICSELYNGQFGGSQDWLDSLMKDDRSCLVEDCMLISGISSSLSLQPPPINSEHSYSLAADCSVTVVKSELEDCMYYQLMLYIRW